MIGFCAFITRELNNDEMLKASLFEWKWDQKPDYHLELP